MPALETDFAQDLHEALDTYKSEAKASEPIFDYIINQKNLSALIRSLTGEGTDLLRRFLEFLEGINGCYHNRKKKEAVKANVKTSISILEDFLHVQKRFKDWVNLIDADHPSMFSTGRKSDLEHIQGIDLLSKRKHDVDQERDNLLSSLKDLLLKAKHNALSNKASDDVQPIVDDAKSFLGACRTYADQETNLTPVIKPPFRQNTGAVARKALQQVNEPSINTVQPVQNITTAHLQQNQTVDSFYFTKVSDYTVTEKEDSLPSQIEYRKPLLHVIVIPNTNPPKKIDPCFQMNIANHLVGLCNHREEKTLFDKKKGHPTKSDVRRIATRFKDIIDEPPAADPLLTQRSWTSDEKLTDYHHDGSPMRLRLDKLDKNVSSTKVSSMGDTVRVRIHTLPHGRPAC